MYEIIVRLTRTIANYDRLRMLSCLLADGESTPTRLAVHLKIAPNALSTHLAKLANAGLIKRRRSAAWSYCIAESPYAPSTLSGRVFGWLREVLAEPERTLENCGLHEVRNSLSEKAAGEVHRLVFQAATAFTDLRRLQLLRRLASGEDVAVKTLCQDLHMSAWAVERHTDKLIRRGYLASRTTDNVRLYRFTKTFSTPIHEGLWEIIRWAWRKEPLRTS
jgi:DNA-binding MarR family transcriptional regulator